jgi:hypothetical protein
MCVCVFRVPATFSLRAVLALALSLRDAGETAAVCDIHVTRVTLGLSLSCLVAVVRLQS